MKKLLTSLATIALIGGTLTSTTAWSQAGKNQQQSNQSLTNETAQEIANKLTGKTINLDLGVWKNKKIADNLSLLRNSIVKQNLLTEDEAQYIVGTNVKWTVNQNQKYPGCLFLIKKDGTLVGAGNVKINVAGVFVNKILTYNQVTYVGTQNGLWESFDNGKSFTQMGHSQIQQVYAANNVIYVIQTVGGGAYNALYESTNNGKSFTQNTAIPDGIINDIYCANNVIYLSINNSSDYLYESTDNGKTFTQSKAIPTDTLITSMYASNNVVYIGTSKGLYESYDNGKTFTQMGDSQIQEVYAYNNVVYLSQYTSDAAEEALFESTNNGKTFTQNTTIPSDYYINNIYAANSVIYVGTDDGLYESYNNGKTFVQDGHSQIHEFYSLNNVLYLSQYLNYVPDGLYESTDKGETFRKNASIPGNYYVNSIAGANSVVYAGTDDGLYESTDNGKTFNLKI